MSANNQILIKKHNDKYLVFEVMAESWDDVNYLKSDEAIASTDSLDEAINFSYKFDDTEYGVLMDWLAKDGAEVIIIDDSIIQNAIELLQANGYKVTKE
jgi:hypothetical protein